MKSGDPHTAFLGAETKSYAQLTQLERKVLSKHQKVIVLWSIIASFSYALIWYWLPSVDSFVGSQFNLGTIQISLLISSFGAAFILTNFLWGHLNDKYWPNRIVTIGLIIAGISTFLFRYST